MERLNSPSPFSTIFLYFYFICIIMFCFLFCSFSNHLHRSYSNQGVHNWLKKREGNKGINRAIHFWCKCHFQPYIFGLFVTKGTEDPSWTIAVAIVDVVTGPFIDLFAIMSLLCCVWGTICSFLTLVCRCFEREVSVASHSIIVF